MRTAIKELFLLAASLFAMVGHANSGDSSPFLLDTAEGTRIAIEGEALPIDYSPHWNGAASCTVAETGKAALVSAATDEGSVSWAPQGIGGHTLTHTAGGETLTAQFAVLGDDVAVHAGTFGTSETWGTDKVHLVTAAVAVPSGVSLTIQAGVVVKFMPGASLTVASGGSCTAKGVIFTHVNDDTVGGDTLCDGAPAVAIPIGDYAITGNITDDNSTEYRCMSPQILEDISSDTLLSGNRTYVVTNSVTVEIGATLTLPPGTILKFDTGCSLTVNGILDAQGTRSAPIVFTSLKDDKHGGDTNGDGDNTYAQVGDWNGIGVSGTASFDNVRIYYASNENGFGLDGKMGSDGISVSGGTVYFTNSEMAFGQSYAVGVESGHFYAENAIIREYFCAFRHWPSDPIVNSVIYNCNRLSNNSGQTLYNCIIAGVNEAWDWEDGGGNTYSHCVFWNKSGFGLQSLPYSASYVDGNVWGDPLFVDPDNGDFRIAANSPCVDAGDGTVAPETDYWGQPRMDVKAVADTGTPNGDGVCPDIGIYEVPGAAVVPLPDLAVVSISRTGSLPVQGGNALAARCTAGDAITITYVVTNRGAAAVSGIVRDLFRFKGADAATGGLAVDAAEIEQAYNIAAGGCATLTATITVPMLKAGLWKVEVGVNMNNYPYEQNLSNNRATTEETISVELEAMGMGTQSVTVGKGETAGFVLSGLPAAGGVARITGEGVAQIAAYGGNGAVPGGDGGGRGATALPNGHAGRVTLPTVPLADGSLLIVFPARAEGENAYLVLENGGDETAKISVEVAETELKIYGAEPGRIANAGEATVTITGSGMCDGDGHAGRVTLPVVTLGGRTAKSVEVLNAAQIAATFDVEGMAAGAVALVATVAGGSPSSATAPDTIEIYAAKKGPKLRAWLEMPPSVRDGRVFTGYVCYANEGDSPMTMPVFKIARQDDSTRMGLVASESMTETKLYVGGISPTHPAGVLKAGDEARIPFYFQPLGSYKIALTHVKDAENLASHRAFGGTKAYLAAMSAAATRLNLRGRTAYDIHDFVNQALWEKHGIAHAAVSGYLVDAKTGEPLANADISLVDARGPAVAGDSRPHATGTTDESGYFQLTNLADGEYRWLMESGMMLAGASTNTVTVADQADLNGVSVLATPGGRISGCIMAENGTPMSGCGVARTDVSGRVLGVTFADEFGMYRFDGLADGTNKVRAIASNGWVTTDSEAVVIDEVVRSAEVSVVMRRGGVVSGKVSKDGAPLAGGFVRAIAQSGASFNVAVAEDGTYAFDGLAAGRYQVGYYSGRDVSDDAYVTLAVGDRVAVDLSARSRPLFEPALRVGFGELETRFFFTDQNRATNVVAWAWDFDSDGTVDSTEASPTWTYTRLGTNTVTLTITENGGAQTTSVYPDCVRIEEAVETVLKDGAIVFGTNSGTLETLELGEGTLVLSGAPSAGDIAVGNAILGKFGDTWYVRRVTGVSRSGDRWTLTTEDGKMTDVYERFAMSISVPAELDVASPRPDQQSARKGPARLTAPAPEEDEDGFRLFAEGGVKAKFGLKPDFRFSLVQDIRDGHDYSMWAIIGESRVEASIGLEGSAGARYKKTIPIPCRIKVPTSVPFLFVKAEADVYCQFTAQISGTAGIQGSVTQMMQIGMEQYDGGDWKWLSPFPAPEAKIEPYGDVEGSFEARMGVVPKFGLEWTVISATVDLDIFMSTYIKAGLNSPLSFGVELGADLNGEMALKVFSATIGEWKTPSLEGPRIQAVQYVGPEPEFSFSPNAGLKAPVDVHFTNQTKGPRERVFLSEKQREASRYEWNFGNGMTSTDRNPSTTFAAEGAYKVSLKAFDDEFITGPYRYNATVTVGDDDDDDDEEDDDIADGTSTKSCDPNEVNGPLGVGEKRLVKPGDTLTYTIYFENKAGLDIADAQEVKVTNPLSEWLDWSTFEMREVAFNNQNDNSLDGLSGGTRDIKMNGASKYVRIALGGGNDGEGAIATTGVAHWYLRVYDPNGTFGWPNDLSGFLPSNDETHRGEGHITYRIKVRDDAPANVVITNSASIVFDANDPIETDPAWWNTVGSHGVAFVESEVEANEGETATIHVNGGTSGAASSVKVYITYNTATAADLALGKTKYPVTLKWEAGEIGEKTITIPIKADTLVEGEEFFTLQLAAANGVEMGEQTVCTVRIADAQERVAPAGATVFTNAEGTVTGCFTKKDKKGNVTAKPMPGYVFTGWYDAKGKKVGAKAALADKTRKSKKATPRFAVAHYLRGLADPANGGKVTGSGLYAEKRSVTLKATPNKNWTFEGWRLASDELRATSDAIVSKSRSLKVSVTNELTYLAMFKPYPKVTVAVDNAKGGTVKGAGSYLAGKTVTLKATPKKGYAFCGWFDADGNRVSLNASYKYTVTADGLALQASFKKESALAKPVLTWDATNLTVGVSCSTKLSVVGESLVSITKVTGLPKGLTYKSGKVSGVPTVAKAVTAKVTVALKSNAKKTWTYSVKLNVSALPAWAVGTFSGTLYDGSDEGVASPKEKGTVTLTVGKTGKISGKLVDIRKKAYPFTATSFKTYGEDGVLRAKATMKYGTKSVTLDLAVGAAQDDAGETVGIAEAVSAAAPFSGVSALLSK